LCVTPWKTMSKLRKNIMIVLTVISLICIYIMHLYKPNRSCTIVTPKGHLNWILNDYIHENKIMPYLWFLLILLPFVLFWKKRILLLLLLTILPAVGIQYGRYTDAQGSIWCYYTSYTSIIASIALFLHTNNIYAIL
jgi:hypothetical protein